MPQKSDFLVSTAPVRHEIETPAGTLVAFVRPLSWIQQQEALSRFVDFGAATEDGNPQIDFGGYWRYVFGRCIEKTEPELTSDELMELSPEVGAEVQKVLPSIFDIVTSFASGAGPLG